MLNAVYFIKQIFTFWRIKPKTQNQSKNYCCHFIQSLGFLNIPMKQSNVSEGLYDCGKND